MTIPHALKSTLFSERSGCLVTLMRHIPECLPFLSRQQKRYGPRREPSPAPSRSGPKGAYLEVVGFHEWKSEVCGELDRPVDDVLAASDKENSVVPAAKDVRVMAKGPHEPRKRLKHRGS